MKFNGLNVSFCSFLLIFILGCSSDFKANTSDTSSNNGSIGNNNNGGDQTNNPDNITKFVVETKDILRNEDLVFTLSLNQSIENPVDISWAVEEVIAEHPQELSPFVNYFNGNGQGTLNYIPNQTRAEVRFPPIVEGLVGIVQVTLSFSSPGTNETLTAVAHISPMPTDPMLISSTIGHLGVIDQEGSITEYLGDQVLPAATELKGYRLLSSGGQNFRCALNVTNDLKCWVRSDDPNDQNAIMQEFDSTAQNVTDMIATYSRVYLLHEGGTVSAVSAADEEPELIDELANVVQMAWSQRTVGFLNNEGVLLRPVQDEEPVAIPLPTKALKIGGGHHQFLALLENGELRSINTYQDANQLGLYESFVVATYDNPQEIKNLWVGTTFAHVEFNNGTFDSFSIVMSNNPAVQPPYRLRTLQNSASFSSSPIHVTMQFSRLCGLLAAGEIECVTP